MARVKCIMMQRDEELLLQPWLRYYGYLFGFENLLVFDHGSVRPEVVATLALYEKLGVEVRRDLTAPADFHNKGQHFRNVIGHWDNADDHDFVFPLDCDEFLGLFTEGGVLCGRAAIHAALEALPADRGVFEFDLSLFNVPSRPGWFAAEPLRKRFARRGAIEDLDHGFHAITARGGAEVAPSPFVYLHHRHKTLARTREAAGLMLDGLVDTDDAEALAAYDGPGRHLTRHFLMDEAAYRSQFDGLPLLEIPQFQRLLTGLGIDSEALVGECREALPEGHAADSVLLCPPKRRGRKAQKQVVFDAERYRARNPDVAASDNLALKHYLVYGHQEGRAL